MKNNRSISPSIIGYTFILLITAGVVILTILVVFKKMIEPDPQSKDLEVLTKKDTSTLIYQEVRCPNTDKWMYRISKVEFEGHTYIVLEDTGSCLLHDPSCKCQNPK